MYETLSCALSQMTDGYQSAEASAFDDELWYERFTVDDTGDDISSEPHAESTIAMPPSFGVDCVDWNMIDGICVMNAPGVYEDCRYVEENDADRMSELAAFIHASDGVQPGNAPHVGAANDARAGSALDSASDVGGAEGSAIPPNLADRRIPSPSGSGSGPQRSLETEGGGESRCETCLEPITAYPCSSIRAMPVPRPGTAVYCSHQCYTDKAEELGEYPSFPRLKREDRASTPNILFTCTRIPGRPHFVRPKDVESWRSEICCTMHRARDTKRHKSRRTDGRKNMFNLYLADINNPETETRATWREVSCALCPSSTPSVRVLNDPVARSLDGDPEIRVVHGACFKTEFGRSQPLSEAGENYLFICDSVADQRHLVEGRSARACSGSTKCHSHRMRRERIRTRDQPKQLSPMHFPRSSLRSLSSGSAASKKTCIPTD